MRIFGLSCPWCTTNQWRERGRASSFFIFFYFHSFLDVVAAKKAIDRAFWFA